MADQAGMTVRSSFPSSRSAVDFSRGGSARPASVPKGAKSDFSRGANRFPLQLIYKYRMRGRDANCVTQPTYRYWEVTNFPDFTGAQYLGTHCGGSVNLTEITVTAKWLLV